MGVFVTMMVELYWIYVTFSRRIIGEVDRFPIWTCICIFFFAFISHIQYAQLVFCFTSVGCSDPHEYHWLAWGSFPGPHDLYSRSNSIEYWLQMDFNPGPPGPQFRVVTNTLPLRFPHPGNYPSGIHLYYLMI